MLAAVVLAGAAGCGAAEEPPRVASAATGQSTAARPAGVPSAAAGGAAKQRAVETELGLKFARCLREHNVPAKDPVDGGQLVVTMSDGDFGIRTKNQFPESMRAGLKACEQFYPPAYYVKTDPGSVAGHRVYEACMRENGVVVPAVQPDGYWRVDDTAQEKWTDRELTADRKCEAKWRAFEEKGAPQ